MDTRGIILTSTDLQSFCLYSRFSEKLSDWETSVLRKQNKKNRNDAVKKQEQDFVRHETLSAGAFEIKTTWKSLTVALIMSQFLALCWELETYLVVVIKLAWTDISVSQNTLNNSYAEVSLSY